MSLHPGVTLWPGRVMVNGKLLPLLRMVPLLLSPCDSRSNGSHYSSSVSLSNYYFSGHQNYQKPSYVASWTAAIARPAVTPWQFVLDCTRRWAFSSVAPSSTDADTQYRYTMVGLGKHEDQPEFRPSGECIYASSHLRILSVPSWQGSSSVVLGACDHELLTRTGKAMGSKTGAPGMAGRLIDRKVSPQLRPHQTRSEPASYLGAQSAVYESSYHVRRRQKRHSHRLELSRGL